MNGHRSLPNPARRVTQRGVTLIELMVALTINLAIVVAAVYLYLGTRESQRALDQTSEANEVGVFALRALGRDIMNAGFYPSVSSEGNDNIISVYTNLTSPKVSAYDTGIFGCDATAFDLSTGACVARSGNAADGIVIGYFTNDAFGDAGGQRKDCNGNDVATATVNTSRVGTAAATLPPDKPLFVANHYRLGDATTVVVDGQTATVRSLECQGNAAGSTAYQPVISNIKDFQLAYGVYQDDNRTVDHFYTAAEVSAMSNKTIEGVSLAPWARITAVRVCVVTQTFGAPSKLQDSTGAVRTYQDCSGSAVNPGATDRSTYKTYTQVFGMRNFLNKTY